MLHDTRCVQSSRVRSQSLQCLSSNPMIEARIYMFQQVDLLFIQFILVQPVFVQPIFVQSIASNPNLSKPNRIGRNGLDEKVQTKTGWTKTGRTISMTQMYLTVFEMENVSMRNTAVNQQIERRERAVTTCIVNVVAEWIEALDVPSGRARVRIPG